MGGFVGGGEVGLWVGGGFVGGVWGGFVSGDGFLGGGRGLWVGCKGLRRVSFVRGNGESTDLPQIPPPPPLFQTRVTCSSRGCWRQTRANTCVPPPTSMAPPTLFPPTYTSEVLGAS